MQRQGRTDKFLYKKKNEKEIKKYNKNETTVAVESKSAA